MATIESLFVTRFYRADLFEADKDASLDEVHAIALSMAEDDEAGIRWCRKHNYPGYTSYSSDTQLAWRFPLFKTIVKSLEAHAKAFAQDLAFDLGRKKLTIDNIWVNVLPEGGHHTSHIHPHSVLSGTFYVTTPKGTALKLEDPRHGFMMHAPNRKTNAPRELQAFIFQTPQPGELFLWESWLRHEVVANRAEEDRISVSFNFSLA